MRISIEIGVGRNAGSNTTFTFDICASARMIDLAARVAEVELDPAKDRPDIEIPGSGWWRMRSTSASSSVFPSRLTATLARSTLCVARALRRSHRAGIQLGGELVFGDRFVEPAVPARRRARVK